MFLNQLSHQEKRMFLDLSIHVAKANDVLSAEEKTMISQYCSEMELSPIELYETEPLETVTDYFSLADDRVKRIIMLEIYGLVYADGSFDEDESAMVNKFAESIGMAPEECARLHDAITEYYSVCVKLAEVVNSEN